MWIGLRRNAPWFGLVLANALLFAPAYVTTDADFIPQLPHVEERGFDLRSYISMWMRRYNQDMFRLSLDFAAMVLVLIATANTRFTKLLRRVFVTYYVVLWVFLVYHFSLSTFFERAPALGEDWRFLLNLGHFLGSVMSLRWALIIAGSVGTVIALTWLCAATFRALQRRAAAWSWRCRGYIFAAVIIPNIALISWLGIERDTPVMQLLSKHAVANWRTSREELARMAELREAVPDRRYDSFTNLKLARKPNFYFLMVEAYGEILATWDMRGAYRALLARVEERLAKAGYHSASAYSLAPVHSGTSWLSISTVHTGTLIDRPLPYAALELVGARVPSITRFFASQGYRTYTLQPGSNDRAGLRRLDMFNHDVVVSAVELAYRGLQYGWGTIPDQYSWGLFRERWFKHPPDPHYVYYMSVSTHWAWDFVPPYARDWRVFAKSQEVPPGDRDGWPPFPEVARIGTELRRSYFESIEYEFRLFVELLEENKSSDIVVVILGDHQPRLETNSPGPVTLNTPLHMLSRDPAFIDRLVASGLTRGMYAEPGAQPLLRHEGLFSLWVSNLVAMYGAPGSPAVPVYPRGIRLSTIRR